VYFPYSQFLNLPNLKRITSSKLDINRISRWHKQEALEADVKAKSITSFKVSSLYESKFESNHLDLMKSKTCCTSHVDVYLDSGGLALKTYNVYTYLRIAFFFHKRLISKPISIYSPVPVGF